jgi:hypothetical protein
MLEGRKVATLNRYRAALSAVLSFVVEEEWLAGNPLHGRRRRHRPLAEREEERDREVSLEEWDRLRAACRKCEDSRLYVLVVCAHASGARQGELMGMVLPLPHPNRRHAASPHWYKNGTPIQELKGSPSDIKPPYLLF